MAGARARDRRRGPKRSTTAIRSAKVPHRDKVMTLSAPFTGAPAELAKTEYRFGGISWTDKGIGAAHRERSRAALDAHVDHRQAGRDAAQAVGSQPGRCVWQSRHAASSRRRVRHVDDSSDWRQHLPRRPGAAPEGARPFLDRLESRDAQSDRLFQTTGRTYETVVSGAVRRRLEASSRAMKRAPIRPTSTCAI